MKTFDKSHADFKANIAEGLDMILDFVANMPLGGTIGIGTTSKAKVKVLTQIDFLYHGKLKSVAANTEVAFTATTDDIAADATTVQERTYLLVSNGTTTKLVAGTQADTGLSEDPSETLIGDNTVLGRVVLQVAAGETDFDASTDELDAAHITDVYEMEGLYAPRFSDIM
jgi:hypothetical protein